MRDRVTLRPSDHRCLELDVEPRTRSADLGGRYREVVAHRALASMAAGEAFELVGADHPAEQVAHLAQASARPPRAASSARSTGTARRCGTSARSAGEYARRAAREART